MRVVVQRANNAKVVVDGNVTGSLKHGLVLLVGFTEGDTLEKLTWMANKISHLRIFPDENDVMNLSLLDVGGSILSVSQFTLYADASKGNRPSYAKAMNGQDAKILWDQFNEELRKFVPVQTGVFGAHMEVTLTNVGPSTIILER